jgi:hypothetical protein
MNQHGDTMGAGMFFPLPNRNSSHGKSAAVMRQAAHARLLST